MVMGSTLSTPILQATSTSGGGKLVRHTGGECGGERRAERQGGAQIFLGREERRAAGSGALSGGGSTIPEL
jgi:hypothetical protein